MPIFETGDRCSLNNYWPVSVLVILSKVYEKAFAVRLQSFLSINHILNSDQFGFRSNFLTDLALHKITAEIYSRWENRLTSVTTFMDLTKAFDSIDHSILLKKCKVYGITNLSLAWLSSYLSERTQQVKLARCISNASTVKLGVPQVSIFWPILFTVYINDIFLAIRDLPANLILCADDTTALIKNSSVMEALQITVCVISRLTLVCSK